MVSLAAMVAGMSSMPIVQTDQTSDQPVPENSRTDSLAIDQGYYNAQRNIILSFASS